MKASRRKNCADYAGLPVAKPRIIFVNRVFWPSPLATAQLLADLATGLAARLPEREVHVIAEGDVAGPHWGATIHRTGPESRPGGLIARALAHRAFCHAARQQLRKLIQPGDIVVPMTDPPLLAAAVARDVAAGGAHLVTWSQDIFPEIAAVHFGMLARIALSYLQASRDAAWRGASTCVALGHDMARSIAARGIPTDRIIILPNWAPRELHIPAGTDAIAACRQRWAVGDKFVVAYSGNLGRVHEFATILQAAAELRGQPQVVILFIGQGARIEEVRTTARTRGLDRIRFLPPEPRENLAASLAAADVHLVTLRSGYAGLVYPSKLAGVLAVGRPVLFVGPTDGEIATLLRRENCGVALAPGDATGLATTITQWQADLSGRTQLGRNARTAYERQFTFSTALDRWTDCLRRLGPSPSK